MNRRFIAVVGMIALAFAYLPGVVSALSANASPTCCAGMLCPMHHMSSGHMNCNMDPAHRNTKCEACAPHHPLAYTSGAVFNRVAPPPAASERPAGAAPRLLLIARPSLEPEVVSPPPRLAWIIHDLAGEKRKDALKG
jgi:hypothetical protein